MGSSTTGVPIEPGYRRPVARLLAAGAGKGRKPYFLTLRPEQPDTFGDGQAAVAERVLAWLRLGALVAGVVLVGASVGFSIVSGRKAGPALDRELLRDDRKQVEAVSEYFDTARDLMLLEAQNPAFADFYSTPGGRSQKVATRNPFLEDAVHSQLREPFLIDGSTMDVEASIGIAIARRPLHACLKSGLLGTQLGSVHRSLPNRGGAACAFRCVPAANRLLG